MRGRLTRVEKEIAKLEGKRTLGPSEQRKIKRLLEQVREDDTEFEQRHLEVLDFIKEEDQEALDAEETVSDKHGNRVMEIVERLEQLESIEESEPLLTAATDPSRSLIKRLGYLEQKKEVIIESAKEVVSEPESHKRLRLQKRQEDIGALSMQLSGLVAEILSLTEGDASLMETASSIDKDLSNQDFEVRRLLLDFEENHKPSEACMETSVELPKISAPTFDGDILNWVAFWEQFETAIHNNEKLNDAQKFVYLREALKMGPAKQTIQGLSHSAGNYSEAIECLRKRFDKPRIIHRSHVKALVEAPIIKTGSGKELRYFHDVISRHVRSLRTIKGDTFEAYLSASMEMKLDQESKFAWQQYTHDKRDVPSIDELLEFVDWRAQASEFSTSRDFDRRPPPSERKIKTKASYQVAAERKCVGCNEDSHPLYTCSSFQALTPEERLAKARAHSLCLNCLRQGHFASNCQSAQRCKKCRRKHHTMLHFVETKAEFKPLPHTEEADRSEKTPIKKVVSHFTNSRQRNILLMTCQVMIRGPNGSLTQARALLDSGSEASFITERLAQQLRLSRRRSPMVACIGGTTSQVRPKGMVDIQVTDRSQAGRIHLVEALVLPRITSDIPATHVGSQCDWKHLQGISLADPDYGIPKAVDLLLGADIFSRVVLHGRRFGPSGSPSAFKTQFGWVLAGTTRCSHENRGSRGSCYLATTIEDPTVSEELLRKFWEIEDPYSQEPTLSVDEKIVVEHFERTHQRDETGRFVVPLPRRKDAVPLGDSRMLAVKRLKTLEGSLRAKGQFGEFARCINEYFEMGHAEPVPKEEIARDNFYMPMHAVRKESSTTTKIRVVFDASAKSTSGSSLNDQFLVGPTVHAPLIDVLIRFRLHRVAMATDVTKMYRGILLSEDQRDLHRFIWREDCNQPIRDYRMTRLTFGVCASPFAANMALRQNALDHQLEFPRAAKATLESFYVDDGLVGADSIEDAIQLREELQHLFSLGGFELKKWKTSNKTVEQSIAKPFRDEQSSCTIKYAEQFTKVLGVEWNAITDTFRPKVSTTCAPGKLTKRLLMSGIARLFDILGWCSPAIIIPKVLLQRLWGEDLGWDEIVPSAIGDIWEKWSCELGDFQRCSIRRSYFPKDANIITLQLHGFSDASEMAYAGVVYLRGIDSEGVTHISLVIAKTKVAPIKRMTIPRLELCGALIVARLLKHMSGILHIPTENIYAWTDSEVVLAWLRGDPRRFKVFVGNRVSEILELILPKAWRHVAGKDNPADCATRGLYPSQLAGHTQWWQGPEWLRLPEPEWPAIEHSMVHDSSEECTKKTSHVVLHANIQSPALPLLRRVSSYSRLIRITAWVRRYVYNCRHQARQLGVLTTKELKEAEVYWFQKIQSSAFPQELKALRENKTLSRASRLITFRPFIDDQGLLRVGGRLELGRLSYGRRHPILLPRDHEVIDLLITHEHVRLLHAGPTAVSASLAQRLCIVRGRRAIRAKIRDCVTCKRIGARPKPQLLGQLPRARLDSGDVFRDTGVDYAGPIYIKGGPVRKPIFTKCYVAVFVSMSVKAVHLEPVTELTTSAFIATLRRFVARRGLPATIWSDNGSNFVGAANEIRKLVRNPELSDHCNNQGIQWRFTPEHAPHFGGLWEAAVKSFKTHLRRIVGEVKLTYEELTTTLAQIEACLNSRPLTPLPESSDALEVLTPGHFLIGKPLTALPNPPEVNQPIALLRRWHLCQKLASHFWYRWSHEYLTTLNRLSKWQNPARNLQVGDVVCLRDEPTSPTKWPLARVIEIHPGQDGRVRVVTVRTPKGTYKRPIVKVVPLLSTGQDES